MSHIRPGTIYLLRACCGPLAGDGIHKVGLTNDLQRRRSQLRSKYRTDFAVVHQFQVDDVHSIEMAIRTVYQDIGVAREFFRLTPEMVDAFCSLSSLPPVKPWLGLIGFLRSTLLAPVTQPTGIEERRLHWNVMRQRHEELRAMIHQDALTNRACSATCRSRLFRQQKRATRPG
jgi:hypothetical protein